LHLYFNRQAGKQANRLNRDPFFNLSRHSFLSDGGPTRMLPSNPILSFEIISNLNI